MLRYSVLRLLIFFGVLSLLWLLGLRDQDQQWMLLVISALISMVLSFFVLARFREESTRRIAERLQQPGDLAAPDAQVAELAIAHRRQLAMVAAATAHLSDRLEQAGSKGGLSRWQGVTP